MSYLQNNDVNLGWVVLNEFQKALSARTGSKLTSEQIAKIIQPKNTEVFVEGLGLMYREGLSSNYSKMKEAVSELAKYSSVDKLPKLSGFSYAFTRAGSEISKIDAFKFVVVESTKQVAQGAAVVGDKVIETGKTFLGLAPIALLLVGGAWVYGQVKSKSRV